MLFQNLYLISNFIYLNYFSHHRDPEFEISYIIFKYILSISLGTNIGVWIYFFSYNEIIYSNFLFIIEILSKGQTLNIIQGIILGFLFIYIEISIVDIEIIIILIYLFGCRPKKIGLLDDLKLKVYNAISMVIILFIVYWVMDIITPDWYESSFACKYNSYKPWVVLTNFIIAFTLKYKLWDLIINKIKNKRNLSSDPKRFIFNAKDEDYINRLEKINTIRISIFIFYFVAYTFVFWNISYINIIVLEISTIFIASLGICKEIIFLGINNILKLSGMEYGVLVIGRLCNTIEEPIYLFISKLYYTIEELGCLFINKFYNIIIEWILNIIKIIYENILFIINLAWSDILSIWAYFNSSSIGIYLMDGWGNNNPYNNSWDVGSSQGPPNNGPPYTNYINSGFDDSDSNQYYEDNYSLLNSEPFQYSSNNLPIAGESSTQLTIINNLPVDNFPNYTPDNVSNLPVDNFPNYTPDNVSNLPANEMGITYASNSSTAIEPRMTSSPLNNTTNPIYPQLNFAHMIGSFTIGDKSYVITYRPNSNKVLLWLDGECVGVKWSNGTYLGKNILGRRVVLKLPDRRMYIFDLFSDKINFVKTIVLGLPDKMGDLTNNLEEGFIDITYASNEPSFNNIVRALNSYTIYGDHHVISIMKNYEAGSLYNINRCSLAESPDSPWLMNRNYELDYNLRFYRFPNYFDIEGCKNCKFDTRDTFEWLRNKEQWLICMVITHRIQLDDPKLGFDGGLMAKPIPKLKYFLKTIREYYERVDKLKNKRICDHGQTNNEVLKSLAMRWYIDRHLRGLLLWNKSFIIPSQG